MMILIVSVFSIQAIALLSSASVVTDKNGLIYMRARYYSPDMKRFINADIVAGQINNAVTLNRYAYANANPVMFVDPLGLSASKWWNRTKKEIQKRTDEAVSSISEWATNSADIAFDYIVDMATAGSDREKMAAKTKAFSRQLENTFPGVCDVMAGGASALEDWSENKAREANALINSNVIEPVRGFISNIGTKFENEINIVKKICNFPNEIPNIIVNNVAASAVICIGMGGKYDGVFVGIEAISRMDIIGIQLKDGNVRIGHPGKSGVSVTLPTGVPSVDVTLGPQNNTYENIEGDYREIEDTTYVDVGPSFGVAAAFVVGFHYDISLSYSEMLTDVVKYFQ